MGRLWLVCCRGEDAAWVRSEIEARDARARLLRLGDRGRLAGLAASLAKEGPLAAAICAHGLDREVAERAIGDVARSGAAEELLAFWDGSDAGDIARLFHAGATEVIAAGAPRADTGAADAGEARMGEGPDAPAPQPAPVRDDRVPEAGFPSEGARPEAVSDTMPAEDAGTKSDADASGRDAPGAMLGGAASPGSSGAFGIAREDSEGSRSAVPAPAPAPSARERAVAAGTGDADGHRAPVIAAISGRGGCGKTTLVVALAACVARAGLRAAVIDADLMFGNAHEVLGIDMPRAFEIVGAHATEEGIAERDVEAAAMRVGPGVTLWGPCGAPEQAELMGVPAERLIAVLRGLADVILVDTSVFWGDAVAAAVGACDRCLVVGSGPAASVAPTVRAMELAMRIGVPKTKMTCVFNRLGAHGCGEEQAMRFEMGLSLRSRSRISDGGDEVAAIASLSHLTSMLGGSGAFARSIRDLTCELMGELGRPVDRWLKPEGDERPEEGRRRIRLPWPARDGDDR